MSEEPSNTVRQWSAAPPLTIDPARTHIATIQTTKGAMRVRLFADEAPIAVNNFIFLARNNFYDTTPFHRIIQGFMIQGGDGQHGNGTGGPGYRFADEEITREYVRGTVAMANAGPNTNGSQFFIIHADYPLPKQYAIFGIVIQGFDVLDAIAATPVGPAPNGERSSPLERVSIMDVTITEQD
jgi:cyclophilin family peptidyl-prolyl cis-trans isomerase